MKKNRLRKLAGLVATYLAFSVGLAACGEASPAATAIPLSPTSAAVVPAPVPTATPQTITAAPVLATVTAPNTASPIATTVAPTPVLIPSPTTGGGLQVLPTITALPTPQPAPPATGWTGEGVCYEVFVRSFYDSNADGIGDLNGLIARLDYINDGNPASGKSLGANCIWLMPITSSPSYHGYDTTDYYRVNPDYGTNDDFKKLVQEAHKRGINVLIDFVPNHTSLQHPWFKEAAADPKSKYRDYYIFSETDPGYAGPLGQAWHKNPFGSGFYYAVFDANLPDLNLRHPEVTRQLYDVARFWLQDMGADGFRIDAVKHFIENGPDQVNTRETRAWLRDFRKYYTGIKPEAYTIGEINGPTTELLGYYPDQLDHYFDFGLAQSVVNSARNSSASFVNLVKDSNTKIPFQRYGSFLTNHDQTRVMSVLAGDVAKMKLAATALLTLPGLPYIYYGEEIGMQGFKPDPDLRRPMQWTAAPNGGFTTGPTPWRQVDANTKSFNVQAQEADPGSLLNLYRKLIRVRRSQPALAQGEYFPVSSSESKVASFVRQNGNSAVLVVLNMDDDELSGVKLSLEGTKLADGQYSPTLLFGLDNAGVRPAPLTVAGGAITDYTPVPKIASRSGYVIQLGTKQ